MNNTNLTTLTQEEIKKRLVNKLSIEHLKKEEQTDIINQVGSMILDRISLAMLAKLPKEVISEVETLLDDGETTKVQELMQKYIPNINEEAIMIMEETIVEYQNITDSLVKSSHE